MFLWNRVTCEQNQLKNFLIVRYIKCDFPRFVEKVGDGELPQNYSLLHTR